MGRRIKGMPETRKEISRWLLRCKG
jgi:hypothetical protein